MEDQRAMHRCLPVLALLLGACASEPQRPSRDLAAEVRAGAAGDGGVLEVRPLADPEAEELLRQARWLEERERLDAASEHVERALNIAPRQPEYWQYLAELDLKRGRYQAALDNARHSFELGPQLGPLCVRNWLTLSRARQALGRVEDARVAEQRADACRVRERATY